MKFIERIHNLFRTEDYISDGYHSFGELYGYRMAYNAGFFNLLAMLPGNPYKVHKSLCHSDGTPCFDGKYFIVMAILPTGQISNHYEMKDWKLFCVPQKEKADKWDKHSPTIALLRMRQFLNHFEAFMRPKKVVPDPIED